MPSSVSSPHPSRASSLSNKKTTRGRHRSTLSLQKTEVVINVYDLLPQGKLSSFLWFIGSALLHSGVVVNGREYAYGGHDHKGMTGVYWTRPKTEPAGVRWKCSVLHGFSLLTEPEIDQIVQEASGRFQGTSYNLLTNNCNHFTSYLCQKLTAKRAPNWLNRAAGIGVTLPCVVPREWIAPPNIETAGGEPVDEEDEDGDGDDRVELIADRRRDREQEVQDDEQGWWDEEVDRISRSADGRTESADDGERRSSRWFFAS